MFNWSNLVYLVLPAAILAVVPFFIKFFGKVIADQTPYADDKEWTIELQGLFFLMRVVSIFVGVYLFITTHFNPFKLTGNDWLLLLASGLVFLSIICVSKKSKRFFTSNIFKTTWHENNLQSGLLFLVAYALILLAYFYFLWHAYIYIIPLAVYFLILLVGFALFLSLNEQNILIADIYFIDKEKRVIKGCRILKINNDTIRYVVGDEIHLVNKSQILEVVTKRDPVYTNKK